MKAWLVLALLLGVGSAVQGARDFGKTCPVGQTKCGDKCRNLLWDKDACGSCTTKCGDKSTCVNGVCQCNAGRTSCGGQCIETWKDRYNCGGCGLVCSAGQECLAGQCMCSKDKRLCNSACTDVKEDSQNCGACGVVCPADQRCSKGSCRCSGDTKNCFGTCTNTYIDINHCGGCGRTCDKPPMCRTATGATCKYGKCSYPINPGASCTTPTGSTSGICQADGKCVDKCEFVKCTSPGACETATGATCDSATGKCSYPANTGASCTTTGGSTNGLCQADKTCVDLCEDVTCDQPGDCETATGATCDSANGKCSYPADTGATCTTTGGSTNGLCQADKTCVDLCEGVTCDQPGNCETATDATCDSATGKCSYPADTGATCTTTGGSTNGLCHADKTCIDLCEGVTCNQPGDCETATGATCNSATGKCSYPADTGATCTTTGGSTNGLCQADKTCVDLCEGVTCDQPGACETATGATCNSATGQCSYPADTGASCTTTGGSTNGLCQADKVCLDLCEGVTCDQPGTCETATGATCDSATGQCSYPADEGSTCNGTGVCLADKSCTV